MKTLIVIVGPTAVGKTSLALHVAKHFSTEIISADSRQFFRETEIGTAKPSADDLASVKHHFINSHSIQTLFSTGHFEQEALKVLDQIFEDHETAVAAGGSGLYVNALCHGLDELPDTDLTIRKELNEQYEADGIESLKKKLQSVDPEYFTIVDTNNPQRMIRGVEFFLSTGQKLSVFLTKSRKQRPFRMIKIGLNIPRERLYQQINTRVDEMMDKGLLTEVEELRHLKHLNALKTVGYTELFEHLEGKLTLDEAIDKIKRNTRRFAKRQLTWFNRDQEITWFEPGQEELILSFIENSLKDQTQDS